MPEPQGENVENAAHQALRTLYHCALAGDPRRESDVRDAYLVMVDYLGTPAGIEPERIIACGRLLLHSGDITPMGVIILEKIAMEAQ